MRRGSCHSAETSSPAAKIHSFRAQLTDDQVRAVWRQPAGCRMRTRSGTALLDDDHLSDVPGLGHKTIRIDHIAKGKHFHRQRANPAVFEKIIQSIKEFAHERRFLPGPFHQVKRRVHDIVENCRNFRRLQNFSISHFDEPAPLHENGKAFLDELSRKTVEDNVHASSRCGLQNLVRE